MPTWLEVLLEIIKIAVPGLIVFLTAYYLLGQQLQQQRQAQQMELVKGQKKASFPVRLQAYERLSLFCERIAIPSLLLRLRTDDSTNSSLRVAMLLAIQQEFEHNITQQLYVSEKLWEIVKMARDETVSVINGIYENVDPQGPGKELAGTLFKYLQMQEGNALDVALAAIRKEAGLLL
ncbi:MAG: hypothetical protein KDC43_20955 [Saprospiraceae bacterium]|nr:hypothetical protein [Saprospiraceae bacterium]MCB0626315.1 hypothetical protein [Saprospiraceae bacterium]MCB0678487.1 hypothetical protein [Saprospiraceae bacterium]MCB0680129.1 hypothetical protein [Saprospiraceae bacterium]